MGDICTPSREEIKLKFFIKVPAVKYTDSWPGVQRVQIVVQLGLCQCLELVRAECVCCPWLQAETKVATILGIGPSGVRALPLAAGINVGGHYFWYFIPLILLPRLLKPQKGLS